jgi:2-keto-4-pentenoate hydratase/2-oxohepta-3-ene-1,7-dioic acid hydratase in catechol pathway
MKIVRYEDKSGAKLGAVTGEGVVELTRRFLSLSDNTIELIMYDQIAYLSQAMTLEPGDLIFTGTPGGVGGAMQPPKFFKAGNRVRVEFDRIGALAAAMRLERAS